MALFAIFYVLDCASIRPIQAQSDESTVLMLAQSFIAEAGWLAEIDHAAIGHVLKYHRERRGVSYERQISDYVSVFRTMKDGSYLVNTDRAKWVRELNFEGTQPMHWPSKVVWSEHRDWWFATINRARAFLVGKLRNPCPGAKDWGSADDLPRGRMEIAPCSGATRNTFYTYRLTKIATQ